MSELQHFLLGFVSFQIIWHLFLKKYFIFEDEIEYWEERIRRFLNI